MKRLRAALRGIRNRGLLKHHRVWPSSYGSFGWATPAPSPGAAEPSCDLLELAPASREEVAVLPLDAPSICSSRLSFVVLWLLERLPWASDSGWEDCDAWPPASLCSVRWWSSCE